MLRDSGTGVPFCGYHHPWCCLKFLIRQFLINLRLLGPLPYHVASLATYVESIALILIFLLLAEMSVVKVIRLCCVKRICLVIRKILNFRLIEDLTKSIGLISSIDWVLGRAFGTLNYWFGR